mgnify:CR=1 FL=1
MKKIFLIAISIVLALQITNAQSIMFSNNQVWCVIKDINVTRNLSDEEGVFVLDEKSGLEAPYTITYGQNYAKITLDVVYDRKYNYPVSALFSNESTLSEKKRFSMVSMLVREIEILIKQIGVQYGKNFEDR